MTTEKSNSHRVQWVFIGLLGCLAVLTACFQPPRTDEGVTCFLETDSNIIARAPGDPERTANYTSPNGGMTWQKRASEKEGYPPGGICWDRTDAWQTWATVDGKIRYRFTPNTSIERSEDGGETLRREVDLTGEALKPKTPTSQEKNYGPLDAMVHYPTGNVVVAMGRLGILVRTPDAQWQWIRVANYYRGTLAALKTPVPRMATPVPLPTPALADRDLKANLSTTCGIAFSGDGRILVSTAMNDLSLWRTEDWSLIATVGKLGREQEQGMALSPDGAIVAISDGNAVQLWGVPEGNALQRLEVTAQAPTYRMLTYVFSPDGTSLATGATDGTIRFWNVADGSLLRTIGMDAMQSYSPDGQVMIKYVGGGNATSLAFSPNGLFLAANTASHKILVWRIADGKLLYTFDGGSPMPGLQKGTLGNGSLVFSADGQMLFAFDGDSSLRVWRMTNGSLIRMLMLPLPHGIEVTSAAFSSDRQILATGSYGTIWLWRLADVALLRRFTINPDIVKISSLAFSPDDRMLAAMPSFAHARVWFLSP